MKSFFRTLCCAAIILTITLYHHLSKEMEDNAGIGLLQCNDAIATKSKNILPPKFLRREDARLFLRKSKHFDKSSVLNQFPDDPLLRTNQTQLKRIFFYTKYFRKEPSFNLGMGSEQFETCKFKNCFTTNNKQFLNSLDKFDAVLFHPFKNFSKPPIRSPDQLYIMQRYETPISNEFPYEEFRDFFNWTLSDRFDADVFIPRATFLPKGDRSEFFNKRPSWNKWQGMVTAKELAEIKEEYKKKTAKKMDAGSLPRENAIGWIVAHCNTCSDREVYANELNKYYPVVARGFCSGITCSGETLVANLTGDNVTSEISQANIEKDSNTKFEVNLATIQLFNDKRKQVDDGCDKLVHRYKYYLAFENSVCLDYISEKIHKPYLSQAIPIVLGGAKFDRVMPPHSYIDAMDFDSPKALAEYLKYLDQDEDKYMEYFWWWKYYDRYTSSFDPNRAACVLCQMLNQPEIHRQSYSDIGAWYLSPCERKGSFPWSRPEMNKFGCKKRDMLTFKDMGLTL